jgi:transposase
LARLPPCQILHADKGYDSNAIRRQVEGRGAIPNIPPKANRKHKRDYDKDLYQARHLIENFFAKLKQFRAIATRYDKTARNFLAFVHVASIMILLR